MADKPNKIMCFDLDGVICELRPEGQTYRELQPVPGAAEKLQQLREAGYKIIISTARHMNTTGGNVGAVVARLGLVTLEWLKTHGIPYDEIHFGKPYAQLYVDDNAMRFTSWDDFDPQRLPRSHEERFGEEAARHGLRKSVVVLTMAGQGSRFQGTRFVDASGQPAKPFIDVCGMPMCWWALRSLFGVGVARLILVIPRTPNAGSFESKLIDLARNALEVSTLPVEVVLQDGRRDGQLLSALEARRFIEPDIPVLIAGADTYVASDLGRCVDTCPPDCRGLISVANLPGDRWSFARTDDTGAVVEVAEKKRISDHASTGLYWFASGAEFLKAADALIRAGVKVNNEFYVMPVYQQLPKDARIEVAPAREVWDMGTPDALEAFLSHVRRAALSRAV